MLNELYLFNSLHNKKEKFTPFDKDEVKMYTCGFTVYDHTHIGHIRKYIGDDILKRVLNFNGFKVKHVQNVTDVGHLTSDSDTGEDKMEKGAKKYNMSVMDLARTYEKEFYSALEKVNIIKPDIIKRAADDDIVAYQIELIEKLIKNDYAYIKDQAIYFDTAKLPDYNPFSKQSLQDKLCAREEVVVDKDKKCSADFVLWMFCKGAYENHVLRWDSPWGVGFPGWHIECSAICLKYLGENIDIHTGGVDHKEIHHPNEIAQNYGLTGKSIVNFWMHYNFLVVDGKKMSKSLENMYSMDDLIDKGYEPLMFRYYVLNCHYRKVINFTFDGLKNAKYAFDELIRGIQKLLSDNKSKVINQNKYDEYYNSFLEVINDDINTSEALAVLWNMLQDKELDDYTKLKLVDKFDEVLGLDLTKLAISNKKDAIEIKDLPKAVKELVESREEARKKRNFKLSDDLRLEIEQKGYKLEDLKEGPLVKKM